MTFWLIQVFNGISFGMLLFLLASGLSLIFGLMGIVNLAHGSFYILGAYVAVSVVGATGSFLFGAAAGVAAVAAVGSGLHRGLLHRFHGRELAQVLLTFGFIYLFEDLVKAISWTNTTWTQAVRMIGRLGELGDPCPAVPGLRAFPSARQVLEAGGRYLRDEARLGYRAAYILELSRRVCSGELDLDALEGRARAMAAGELARELTRIRGVGKASAAYVLSMLGHYEHLILDSWTRACAARAFFDGRYPEEKEVEVGLMMSKEEALEQIRASAARYQEAFAGRRR